jgi:CheY-like chemotaxis protein
MSDPRKPRQLKPRALNVLVADANGFSRGLIGEILRNLGVANIASARSVELAMRALVERSVDVILLSWDDGDALDALGFVRAVRKLDDNRIRRLPIVLITSGLTRQLVISGRDAGVDEFLNKPISPVALRQRLEMVVETPRPFIDSSIFLGPCRRRKNPADYHGARRRAGERAASAPMIDQDELARETPIRLALTDLRQACADLRAGQPEALAATLSRLKAAKDLTAAEADHALHAGLASFEAYIGVAVPLGQVDETVINTAINAIEQLAALPPNFADARDSVAIALGKVIQKKLAA